MKTRYALLPLILLGLIAQLGLAQGDPGMPPPNQELKFVSQPPLFGRVDVPYKYTAKAISRDTTAVIHYFYDSITMNPVFVGFTIDSVTGVVTWTPKMAGYYPLSIMARSDKGEIGFQRFTVAIASGNGIVQGKVTDTTGAGIPGVVIELLQAVDVTPANTLYFLYTTKTEPSGNYRISNVDPGKYKLHAVSPDPRYASQWYDGKATAAEANVITVPDSPDVTPATNIVLRGGIIPQPLISVSGMVKDTASAPIAGAGVFFVQVAFALNSNSTVDDFRNMFDLSGPALDFRMDGRSVHVFHDTTGVEGKYSLKVVPGEYIAFARKRGYFECFLVNATDMLSAKRLTLLKDTTGVDFVLRKLPEVPLGSIAGSVLDTAKGVGVPSRIIAFRDLWISTAANVYPFPLPRTFTVDTDSLGAYKLANLPPGGYFVLALPMGSYAPAFYTAADTFTTNWRRASRVVVNGNDVTGINIYVHQIPAIVRGYTGITGTIHNPPEANSTPAGTIIYAISTVGVAGFGIADASGHYEIAGLAPGAYTITADLPGFDLVASKSATVSYGGTGVPQYATIDLNMNLATTSVEESGSTAPEKFELSQNYPNPFNPTTGVRFQVPGASDVKLVVYDILGREVATLVNERKAAGSYEVRFDGTGLASGVYFYKLSAGAMTVTKKMMLLK